MCANEPLRMTSQKTFKIKQFYFYFQNLKKNETNRSLVKKLDNNLFFLNIQTRVNEGSTIWAGVMELRVQAAAWDQSCATAAAWPTTKA